MMIDPYFIILMPIILASIFYFFPYKKIKYLTIFIQVCLLTATVLNYLSIRKSGPMTFSIGSFETFALISLKYDLISSVLIILTSFIFLALMIFNLPKDYMNNLFLFLIMILQCLIIAIFLSNDLFNIYVIYEVSIIIVSILIMFKKESTSIYDGLMYLMINIVAMAFFLFGLGFLYKIFGSLDLTMIKDQMHEVKNTKILILPYAFIMTAIGLKTALMPLFSWLPNAHASKGSPSIISALLSGLYVKAGIYLFIRLSDMFSPNIDMSGFFLVIGLLTGIIGFILAFSQKDIKLILAYSTISQLGLLMIGINSGNEQAFIGAVYHILNHAFFKTTLFLSAGIITDHYKTRNIDQIKGVYKSMPVIAITTIISILGITGAPLFNGSISKYLIGTQAFNPLIQYGMIIINIGTMITFLKYSSIFFGEGSTEKFNVNIVRSITIFILAAFCLIGGVFGKELISLIFKLYVDISALDYLNKSLIYMLSLLVAYLVHSILKKDSLILQRLRKFELGFNGVCISITVFFTVTTLMTYFAIK